MKKILILGILAILTTVSLTTIVVGDNKTIDTNEFSFGDEGSYVNMTMKNLEIGEDLFNNEANIFVYNNATYDYITFDLTGGQNPNTGEYLSDVTVDLGNNGRAEYRFGGTGSGQWGNQSYIMTEDGVYLKGGDLYPTEEGDLYYIKLPSSAVVSSTSVNFTHDDDPIYSNVRIPSGAADWSRSYAYASSTTRSYGYYYPKANAGSYVGYNRYPYYNPMQNGYIKWDLDDPAFDIPVGAEVTSYGLVWNARVYAYRNYIPGTSGTYHSGERDYGVYAITSSWPTYTSSQRIPSSGYTEGTEQQQMEGQQAYLPGYRSTSEDSYTVGDYWGSSSYHNNYDANWDLTDLYNEWRTETLDNNGIMIAMDRTPYNNDLFHGRSSGYSSTSSNPAYRYYFYRGYFYSPSYGTASYRPIVNIGYTLDSENPWFDIGDDATPEWTYNGALSGNTYVTGWQNPLNQYLRTHFPDEVDDYGNEWTYVPIRVGADLPGRLSVSEIEVNYDYTARVYYNPTSGTLLNELNDITPPEEDGWSLLETNVTSLTTGTIKFDNLKLMGEKPNYRPEFMDIPHIDTHEGVIEPKLLKLNDYVYDIDQDEQTLLYLIQMNDQEDHVDLFLTEDDEGTWIGIDTSKEENWYGEVTCQISITDDFGKDAWSNEFTINVESVNDIPFQTMDLPGISTNEGIDPIFLEYTAPSGSNIARGKEIFMMGGGGEPYFSDIEMDRIYLDFELLGPDMLPVNLDWSNQDGHKIYRGPDNEAYLTVLPPEYTDDPDNYLLIFGTEPDFNTMEGSYYLNVYASDDPLDLWNQTMDTVEITVGMVNDPPTIALIPNILMDEDGSYVSTINFIEEYISDVDSDLEDIEVTFIPGDEAVKVSLNDEGNLMVDIEPDFNGVVPITMEARDGENVATAVFNVRIRSINDPPILVVDNLHEEQIFRELYWIRGTADDIEKNLRSVEVAVVEVGGIIYTDDWDRADGAYVWQYLLDIRNFEGGDYIVYIRAFDGRDFSIISEFNVEIREIDPPLPSDPPVVMINTLLTGEISGTITVTGTVSDEKNLISFVEYRVDGGYWEKAAITSPGEWQLILDTKTISNDEHNLSVRAYDEKTYSDPVFKRFTVFNEDSDGDGIPNALERTLLMDPFNKIDGTMDFDNDGFSNQAELMEHNTDPFDGIDHPPYEDESEQLLDTWAMIFIVAAILCAIIIIGLFILNIKLERNIHSWRENLNRKRVERKPKTLLQKIVEIAPTFVGAPMAPEGPALPGGQPAEQAEALPPMQEGDTNPPA